MHVQGPISLLTLSPLLPLLYSLPPSSPLFILSSSFTSLILYYLTSLPPTLAAHARGARQLPFSTWLGHTVHPLSAAAVTAGGSPSALTCAGLAGTMLGPPLAGWLFDTTGDYYLAFGSAACMMLLGAVVMSLPLRCFGGDSAVAVPLGAAGRRP